MKNWKEQYNQLECEWKRYFKDDFAEVYKYLLEDNLSIDEAIIKTGANYNAEDISNLKRCDEILAQGTKLIVDNSEELINEKNEIMYDLILALANEEIKKNIFFKDLKKEDESFDALLMSKNYKCEYGLYTYYRKLKEYKIDVFLEEDFKNVIETLNKACLLIKENNQHPIKIQNKLTELITLYIGAGLGYHLIIILQGLIEWTEKIYDNNNEPEKENALELHSWLLKQASRLYYNYYLSCSNQIENDFDVFFFSTMIGKYIKEHSDEYSIEAIENIIDDNDIPKIDKNLIRKIYNKCNNNQWNSISIDDFIRLLNCDNTIKLSIKKNESNRTKVVFKNIANSIKDKGSRKKWIEFIKKEVFDNVDFMKATLRTDTSCEGYSQIDINFSSFIADLGVSPINKKTPQ